MHTSSKKYSQPASPKRSFISADDFGRADWSEINRREFGLFCYSNRIRTPIRFVRAIRNESELTFGSCVLFIKRIERVRSNIRLILHVIII